jgi:hypothetical protein
MRTGLREGRHMMEKNIPLKTSDDEIKDPSEIAAEDARDAEIRGDKPPHHG